MTKRILLSSPHMGGNEKKYINNAFEQNWIAPLGENVTEFEKIVRDYVQVDHSLALGSGTFAIHLALIECGVTEGDIVFCSSLTFCATSNPILYQNAKPVFIDSDNDTWNMSPYALKKALEKYDKLGKLPKAVLVVNLYGQSAKMDEIKALCEEFNVKLIEDAAESLGSEYNGRKSGSFGDYAIFSFNGNKIITTSGGGMLLSNNKKNIEHALFLSTQARDQAVHYQHSELGYNYRLSNISAGIGRGQMEVLESRVNRRREIFAIYYKELNHIDGINFQPELSNTKSNRWLTALTINPEKVGIDSSELIRQLRANNIEARPVWKPMHLQPLYGKYDYIAENSDNAKMLFENGVCLPSGSNLTDKELNFVINVIKEIIKI
ncbi:aminotransferase class I/II-fold pyridoxal phosphate-dependent enzyme [Staphylococcus hominis]|uniref:Aminotransferase class I/II-fold pyridoxal phosphate-dependent enzyme n=1 Tax=Staphylococcus hominis TaxID=1290 RepID=A0A8X8KJM9_STAHO|nr:aminotransferase class I/II-fold pyridoxal phosphate-dependent enzyme [Staphylococcus hominis]MCM5673276.1 aminotransferase class I/II-fold pyridoxal phosphate-dependent enzyme [Staphylococcus hominis]